jgi:cell division transport system permease protein
MPDIPSAAITTITIERQLRPMAETRSPIDLSTQPRAAREPLPSNQTAIVPSDSIGGRALVAVIAIMTFLASLTTGAVILMYASAADWQSEIAREVTIQVRPAAKGDIEAEVQKAADIARTFPGIVEVRPYSKQESARLLEPWLGTGLALDDLPIPRVIVLKLASGPAPDLAGLRKLLSERVTSASLDDHRGFVDRMRAMANSAVAVGILILMLVLAATVLSVTFATKGAMAANRPIVEVLHLIGAKDGFIAGEFQRHFLLLGIKGGAIGGGLAMALFAIAGLAGRWLMGTVAGDQFASLFGSFSIGWEGYAALAAQIALIAVVTAAASRHTVNQTLESV